MLLFRLGRLEDCEDRDQPVEWGRYKVKMIDLPVFIQTFGMHDN